MILKIFGLRFKFDFLQDCFFLYFVFFFPGKVYTSLTHSISKAEKKTGPEKKNSFFTHSLDFCRKVRKNKLFRGKKNTIPLVKVIFFDTTKNDHLRAIRGLLGLGIKVIFFLTFQI